MSAVADGQSTSGLAITVTAGDPATVTGATVTLERAAGGVPRATLTISDSLIGADEVESVGATVAGLDSDATAVASFTDGTDTVTEQVSADGTVTVDLSSLADGQITSSLAITDTAGNTKVRLIL